MKLRVVIPMRTHSKLNMDRRQWYALAALAKRERRDTFYAMMQAYPAFDWRSLSVLMNPITLRVTRCGPSPGLDRHDNLPASMKNVIDGIADWLRMDDGDPRLNISYAQERHDRWRVIVDLEMAEAARKEEPCLTA